LVFVTLTGFGVNLKPNAKNLELKCPKVATIPIAPHYFCSKITTLALGVSG